MHQLLRGYIVPGMPQPLLAPEQNPGWSRLRQAFEAARDEIQSSGADLLVLYSTQWISVIGHQIQADPNPKWVHVDQEWHELGSIPYQFRMDAEYAAAYEAAARQRGLHARRVSYHGFPIDTGTVVALKLLDPENRIPACVVSCNMYADRGETLVLGKAAADAIRATGKKAIAIAVTSLTHRLHTQPIQPAQDRISSLKDDEWNRKILEILAEGRLEDVSQLARQFSSQAHADQKMKAIWWLAAVMGQNNRYEGKVFEYQPVMGTGAAIVGLTPSARQAAGQEFDEEDVESFAGDRNVLSSESVPPGFAVKPRSSGSEPAPSSRQSPDPGTDPGPEVDAEPASQADLETEVDSEDAPEREEDTTPRIAALPPGVLPLANSQPPDPADEESEREEKTTPRISTVPAGALPLASSLPPEDDTIDSEEKTSPRFNPDEPPSRECEILDQPTPLRPVRSLDEPTSDGAGTPESRGALKDAEASEARDLPASGSTRSLDPVSSRITTAAAPTPVGAYPHARKAAGFLYLSGVGPRQPGTNDIPGGPVRDADGNPLDYDIEAQTRATIENVRIILEASGSSLEQVLDVTVFLIDMKRDFATYNRVYAEYFASIGATRTTLEVRALPTPIAVELKVIALASQNP